ncbi:hypothetical protein Tco_1527612 [Tanacetum coccineum]
MDISTSENMNSLADVGRRLSLHLTLARLFMFSDVEMSILASSLPKLSNEAKIDDMIIDGAWKWPKEWCEKNPILRQIVVAMINLNRKNVKLKIFIFVVIEIMTLELALTREVFSRK